MAQSLIPPQKQDKRKSNGGGGWRQQVRRGWTKFEKGGVGKILMVRYITILKIQRMICKDGRQVKMKSF